MLYKPFRVDQLIDSLLNEPAAKADAESNRPGSVNDDSPPASAKA